MLSRLDDVKQQLLDKAAEVGSGRKGVIGPEQTRQLLGLYYRHAAPEDLIDRSPVDVYGAVLSHYRLASERPQGTATLHAFTPTVEDNEWAAAGHSVIEIVTDDMPFLVDSVTMALSARDRSIHVVIHPQLLVRRDVTGHLLEVLDPEVQAEDESGLVRESWMHIEIDRETDLSALEDIEQGLRAVLRDVREVVEDWQKMNAQARGIVEELGEDPPSVLDMLEINEARALLLWLADDHFTFLGYREYQLQTVDDEDVLRAVPGSGLGILRSDQDMSASYGKLPVAVAAKARERQLLIITKANSRSTVHRPVYLDYVGIKTFDDAGEVVGEKRFLGLFSSAAYTESLTRIPVIREKAAQVLKASGFSGMSHSGKALLDILETYPRDELFQTPVDELLPVALTVLHLHERRQLRFFVRRDTYGRYLSCLVYLPRDRYTTQVRERMQQILKETMGAETLDYTARVSESLLARLHFVVRPKRGEDLRDFDEAALEQRLADATRSWSDDFAVAINEQFGEAVGAQHIRGYTDAFPEAFKEDFSPRVAAGDVRRMEELGDAPIGLALYEPIDALEGETRFKVYRTGTPLSLSDVLPVLSSMGVEVVDERPYELERAGKRAWIYDFGLRRATSMPEGARELFQDAFSAVWYGHAEYDGFSALVLDAGLPWRKVAILRAYAKYFRQGGSTFSQDYLEASLRANVPIARLLVQLFEARFDPDLATDDDSGPTVRVARQEEIEHQIERALDSVQSLDQDRILRSYLLAIRATLRTNFYQSDVDGRPKNYLALKIEPQLVPDLPDPRPKFEVFVYSPRVEGVHLRFGPVARGGLRWSDRREDFRTEILGLVKAQMVKNAVIVPVGAKGGFYCKQLPDPARDREAWLAEGIACYKTFISGLLDITDNLVDGETVPPHRVVRHDGDDSYLVVAADKGTATFSDIANGVAQDYGFWLGDAFASGGSVGYDHKAMGITARGAWESVRRHFRERGHRLPGGGFHLRGHRRHERRRFRQRHAAERAHSPRRSVRSSAHLSRPGSRRGDVVCRAPAALRAAALELADYDTSRITEGGGVFPRDLKAIPVSHQVASALGIEGEVTSMTPIELMRAILVAPVDLLWNGGIGTYVKASTETHADAGDKANDAIRVNGSDLRCHAVGEGGNLGLTQRGRIEYALDGGRIDTDFIDNSAGVDTSDHEVNIKILLDNIVAAGDMTQKQRNALLASMTDEVGRLVLQDNYGQNVALASSLAVAAPLMHVHESWIRRLERKGLIDRQIEFLPTDKEFEARRASGAALTAPELSVLLAYTKIVLADELLSGDLADDPFLEEDLFEYFPTTMRDTYRDQMLSHPLRREIIVTQVVNNLINFAGITFYHRLSQETNASSEDLARASLVCREIFRGVALIERINRLDNQIAAEIQTDMRLSVRTLIERATRWIVNNRRPPMDSEAVIGYFRDDIETVVKALPDVLTGVQAAEFTARRDYLIKRNVPDDVATDVAVLPFAYAALEVVEIAKRDKVDSVVVADVHAKLSERLGLSEFAEKIYSLPRDDRWQTMARASLRDDFHSIHAALTAQVLAATDPNDPAEDRVAAWEAADQTVVARATSTMAEILNDEQTDLARLSVGLRVIRSMLANTQARTSRPTA